MASNTRHFYRTFSKKHYCCCKNVQWVKLCSKMLAALLDTLFMTFEDLHNSHKIEHYAPYRGRHFTLPKQGPRTFCWEPKTLIHGLLLE